MPMKALLRGWGGTVGVDGARLHSTRPDLRQQLGRRDATAMSCSGQAGLDAVT
ncbi:hypothetical protein Syncc8109_2543 [Synechococcus sp. WH 8109]|nr:hypothetical protein Syncc8109_2543 [Synechococcus sp. WH 8109]